MYIIRLYFSSFASSCSIFILSLNFSVNLEVFLLNLYIFECLIWIWKRSCTSPWFLNITLNSGVLELNLLVVCGSKIIFKLHVLTSSSSFLNRWRLMPWLIVRLRFHICYLWSLIHFFFHLNFSFPFHNLFFFHSSLS